jgi:hypothetical protein
MVEKRLQHFFKKIKSSKMGDFLKVFNKIGNLIFERREPYAFKKLFRKNKFYKIFESPKPRDF